MGQLILKEFQSNVELCIVRHGHLTISHNHYLDTPRKLGPLKVGSDARARALQICFWCRIVTWTYKHVTKEPANAGQT